MLPSPDTSNFKPIQKRALKLLIDNNLMNEIEAASYVGEIGEIHSRRLVAALERSRDDPQGALTKFRQEFLRAEA